MTSASYLGVLLSLLSLSLTSISCHNWLWSGSRAELASTFYPWPQKIGNVPHVQVGPGQLFEIEHSMGHGNVFTLYGTRVFSYYLVLSESDAPNVPVTATELRTIIQQYYSQAPASAFLNASDPVWRKVHVMPPTQTYSASTKKFTNNKSYWNYLNSTSKEYFSNQLLPTDPYYRTRDPVALSLCKSNPISGQLCMSSPNNASQWVYNVDQLSMDWRIEYYNPSLPWIESLHCFQTTVTETTYTNTNVNIKMRIPGRKGLGNYMVWFIWNGYFDVIDVNVQSNPSEYPYGKPTTIVSNSYTRVDHCSFTTFSNPSVQCRRVDPNTMNISQCIADCNSKTTCDIIQVARVTNLTPPSPTLSVIPNIPVLWWNSTQEIDANNIIADGPCGWPSYFERHDLGCTVPTPNCNLAGMAENDYVCWAAVYRNDPQLQATAGFEMVSEPEHPYFYNTCYFRGQSIQFSPYPAFPGITTSWIAGDNCVDCAYYNASNYLPINIAPNWETAVITAPEGSCMPCTADS